MSPAALPHILFVDDEPNMLASLRRMLRVRRDAWNVSFANSAGEALEILNAEPCDVIISDYRMPDIDGGALLEMVRDRYPDTGRVILSGYTDESSLLKVLLLAHQFLNKPCGQEEIVKAVERVLALRAALPDEELTRRLIGEHPLPHPPDTLFDLFAVLNSDDVSETAAIEAIERDATATATLLRAVNTAPRPGQPAVADVGTAVRRLGVRDTYALVMLHDLVTSFELADPVPTGLPSQVAEHALHTARLAHRLADKAPWADDAFAAGLVQEVGQLVVARCRPDVYAGCLQMWRQVGGPLAAVERPTIGADHAAIGVYLLNLWGLPLAVIEAVAGHGGAVGAADPSDPTSAVALAHAVVEAEFGAVCGPPDRSGAPEVRLSPEAQRQVALWRGERDR